MESAWEADRTRNPRSCGSDLGRVRSHPTTGGATSGSSRRGRRHGHGSGRRQPDSANSRSFQPMPTPAMTRPPLSEFERRELLGEDHRVALRDDDHARPEADTRVSCTDPGEGQDRVVDMAVLAGIVMRDEDVVGRPDRRPTEPLRDARGGLDALRRCAIGEVGETQAEVHRGDGTSPPAPRVRLEA